MLIHTFDHSSILVMDATFAQAFLVVVAAPELQIGVSFANFVEGVGSKVFKQFRLERKVSIFVGTDR